MIINLVVFGVAFTLQTGFLNSETVPACGALLTLVVVGGARRVARRTPREQSQTRILRLIEQIVVILLQVSFNLRLELRRDKQTVIGVLTVQLVHLASLDLLCLRINIPDPRCVIDSSINLHNRLFPVNLAE